MLRCQNAVQPYSNRLDLIFECSSLKFYENVFKIKLHIFCLIEGKK